MKYKTVSIKETRDNLAEIVERASIGGEYFIITKFGKARAIISPIKKGVNTSEKARIKALKDTFGMWKGRKIKRAKSSRYGKIFS